VESGLLRQVSAAFGVLTLLLATACSGDSEAEGSATSARDEAPAPAATTTKPEEADPSSWRILANAECTSMVSFYEAPFRQRGGPTAAEITANSAETLGNWHAAMVELGALEADRAVFEDALDRYEAAITAFKSGSGGAEDFEQANKIMAGLGLETCVEVVDLVRSGVDPYVDEDVVIHEEDFTDPVSQRWTVTRNDEIASGYVKGRYRVRVKNPPGNIVWIASSGWAGEARRSVRVEVDSVLTGRPSGPEAYGVLCMTEDGRGYFFGIGPPEQSWTIEKAHAKRLSLLAEGSGESAIRQRVNHIGGECRAGKKGTRVRLLVNGRVVRAYRDPKGFRNFRRVGIAVFAPEGGLEVMFDDVKATELRAPGSG
jgi:hypothetical protein